MVLNRRVVRSYLAAGLIVAAGAALYSTVLPDAPVLAFFLSLFAGSIATMMMASQGPDLF